MKVAELLKQNRELLKVDRENKVEVDALRKQPGKVQKDLASFRWRSYKKSLTSLMRGYLGER